MKTAIALLFGLLLIVSGCASAGPSGPAGAAPPETLAGTSWKAVAVAGRSTVAGREPSLAFDANRVSGSGGCNQFGGEYHYDGGRLTFGEMPMTLIGCDEPIGSLETDFLKVLGGGVTVSIDDGGRLLLEGPGGQALLVPAAG